MELLKVDFWIKSKRFSVNLDPKIMKKLLEEFKSTKSNAIAFETERLCEKITRKYKRG